MNDARRHGIQVLPVDVNKSEDRCTIEDGKIRLGFKYVKGVGDVAWTKIMSYHAAITRCNYCVLMASLAAVRLKACYLIAVFAPPAT
ncbi:hypothetical protein M1O20_06185 [Dehalococcoidia bacterium]|nr:hypothetical protein [Dehalococcoidia bacterium]